MDLTLYYNNTSTTVKVKDSSYRYRAVMIEDYISLEFDLPQYTDFPIGTYCTFDGTTYALEQPASFTKNGNRQFAYKMTMYAPYFKANKYKFKNTADNRLKFEISATPLQLLTMIVGNMNARESGWTVGSYISADAKLMEFNHTSVLDALKSIAETFETEYHISGKTITLGKVEYNKNAPLALQYMTGIKPSLGRENYDNTLAVERLYVQGGEQNIDYSKYGSRNLLLPKSKTITYEGVSYTSDASGSYIQRTALVPATHNEDSLDCSDYYPKRVGEVSSVVVIDSSKNLYDIVDSSIPASCDYSDCIIAGSTMTVIFQSGMLAGREFEAKYYHNAVGSKAAKRFELVPIEEDGYTFPCTGFLPAQGDKYIVFGVQIPDAYIQDDEEQTGAAYDMFRAAAKYLYEHEVPQFSFTGEIDPTWSKANWETIGAKIKVGGYVSLTDSQFLPDGELIRIVGVKQYLNYPYEPEVEISNKVSGQGLVSSELRKIPQNEVVVESKHQDSLRFTKRRFRDVNETTEMLAESLDSLSEQWSEGITPITARTMQLRVGDEALQFFFVNGQGTPIDDTIVWSDEDNQLKCSACTIKHYTLGIDSVKPQRAESDYTKWSISAVALSPTGDEKRYYIYAKCAKSGATGELVISETAQTFDQTSYYYLLIGLLNSVYEGTRSIARLYGYTEVLPNQVTAYKYLSPDGVQYLDFLSKTFALGDASKYIKMDTANGVIETKNVVFRSGNTTFPAPIYRGAWAAGTYYRGETVTYNGTTYMCMCNQGSSTTAEPPASPWVVYAQKGTDGTPGSPGTPGTNGNSTAAVAIYKRSDDVPSTPEGGQVYSFTSGQLATLPEGWSQTPPAGDSPVYVSYGYGSANTTTVVIERWSAPVKFVENGEDGQPGQQGATGKSLRGPSVWSATKSYSGLTGQSTFVDVVVHLENNQYHYYYAKVDNSGQEPSAVSDYWQAADEFDFVATKILLANLAYIDNLGTSILKIMQSGNVFGGFMPANTDDNGNIILWAGGTPNNAPFRVNTNGTVSILGSIEADGSFSDGTHGTFSGKFRNGVWSIGDLLLTKKDGKSVVDIYSDPLKINNNWVVDSNELHTSGETAPDVVKHIIAISAENYAALVSAGTTDPNTLYVVSD